MARNLNTSYRNSNTSYMWANWLMLALGVWLFISPWLMVASTAAAWNFWIVGLAMGLLALAALTRVAQWEEWTNLALSGWLFFSPWILNFQNEAPAWNAFIIGIVGAAISIWGIASARASEPDTYAQSR